MQPDATVVVARQNLIWFSAAGLFMVAMMVLTIVTISYMVPVAIPDAGQEQRQICDRVFKDFMATENLVDLERAKFIIDRLNCSVARRLKRQEGE
ncbi:hypothetical protein [Methylosinus sp. RM1]|uniref:hypothetical protein n=1 Tax=Methylosinus sp. RM1 TaxID=2583817 RepID=UPI001407F68B|nr:hypothetical protein [Methylosinus sp. RM1]